MDLEKIIELAKILAKPYKVTTYVLAFLLILSIAGNIYLASQECEVVLEQNNSKSDNNIVRNG